MSKIGEKYSFSCISVENFNKPPIANGKDCFFINDGKNSIAKIYDKKLLHSWVLTHPYSFTSPVIFTKDMLYCVRSSDVLLRWSCNDDNLKSASMFECPEAIFTLLPLDKGEPIILFESGKVLLCSELPSAYLLGTGCFGGQEEIVWADILTMKTSIYIVLLSTLSQSNEFKLQCFIVTENALTEHCQVNLKLKSHTLKSWCLNKESFSFLCLWSNGTVMSFNINDQICQNLLHVMIFEDNLASIHCIDRDHIVIMKHNENIKASSLEIWDMKFRALKAVKKFEDVSATFIQVAVVESVIFAIWNSEIAQIEFSIEKSTLASAIGRISSENSQVKDIFWKKGKIISKDFMQPIDDEIYASTFSAAKSLMKTGASYLKYIPESELIKLLKFAISWKDGNRTDSTDIDPNVILSTIFSAPFSDVFLLKFLKNLTLDEAVVALESLFHILKKDYPDQDRKVSDFQVFSWFCVILQSHMEALLFSQDAKKSRLFEELDKLLTSKVKEFQDYESIQNSLRMLQKENVLPEKEFVDSYCIDTLE